MKSTKFLILISCLLFVFMIIGGIIPESYYTLFLILFISFMVSTGIIYIFNDKFIDYDNKKGEK